ncbi:MAG: hypothetical protein COB15_10780 [Flavobacteriales bacterium]|nr:MAG: hypothetical protein COB15_10780 [Flavobacteriales bacterium]
MKKRIKILLSLTTIFLGCTFFIFSYKGGYQIRTEGVLYIVNKASSNITVFDLDKGEHITKIKIDIEPHEATTLSNNEYVIVTNYGNENTIGKSLTVINTKSNKIEKLIELGESSKPHGITAIPNSNKVIVVTDVGNDLLIVDVVLGKVLKRIPTKQKLSHMVALHPNHKIAVVSNIASNSISIINIEEGKLIKNVVCGSGAEGVDVTKDGKEIWVTNNVDNTISIIDSETLKITATLTTQKQPLRLMFTTNGKQCLVANSQYGTIGVYDVETKKIIKEIILDGKRNIFERLIYHTPRPVGILMHPNGKYAFIANSNANRIEIIELNTLTVVSTIKTGSIPDGMTILE